MRRAGVNKVNKVNWKYKKLKQNMEGGGRGGHLGSSVELKWKNSYNDKMWWSSDFSILEIHSIKPRPFSVAFSILIFKNIWWGH